VGQGGHHHHIIIMQNQRVIAKRSYSQSSENGVHLRPGLFPREASIVQKNKKGTEH
jgi:hypothetical protein